MKPRISTAFLALVVAGAAMAGFTSSTPLSPRPLQAQGICGMFDGLPCNTKCNRECTNGSCCDWSYYYYPKTDIDR